MLLLLYELADETGQVENNETEFAELMAVRLKEPKEYAL
jgi:hypothetical protein